MDLFDVLAVVGAVTGTAGVATQVYTAWRDRADLRVSFGYHEEMVNETQRTITPYLDVVNAGRQPVALLGAGIYGGELPMKILKDKTNEEWHAVGEWILAALEQPAVVSPGQHLRLPLPLRGMWGAVVNDGFHMDHPFRSYLDTPHGRGWGDAGPYVRMVYPDDTRPPEIRAAQWDPCDPPLRPPRVEPRWKLWKKRELRTGETRRPPFDELCRRTGNPPSGSDQPG